MALAGMAAKKANQCPRCHGSGTYFWGAVINGVSLYSGTCFRCQGDGKWHRSIFAAPRYGYEHPAYEREHKLFT